VQASFIIDNALVFVAAMFLGLVYMEEPVFVAPQSSEVSTASLVPLAVSRVVHSERVAVEGNRSFGVALLE
jgi:hypothetical protein